MLLNIKIWIEKIKVLIQNKTISSLIFSGFFKTSQIRCFLIEAFTAERLTIYRLIFTCMTVILLAQNKANYKSIIEEKSGCPGNNTFISFVSELFLSHGANGTLRSDTTFISPFRIGLVKATK